jgi:hypothetical protein
LRRMAVRRPEALGRQRDRLEALKTGYAKSRRLVH